MEAQSLRFAFFISALILFSSLEFFFSYRKRVKPRLTRWISHISMILIGNLLVKLTFPISLVFTSSWCDKNDIGLFNIIEINPALELFLVLILFDLLIYLQHVLSHKINFLWRLHRVHHSDTDLDTTSALRFHPLEILLSIVYKAFCVCVFGVSIEAIFIFEIILNFMAMFNHSNLHIPRLIEPWLRFFIVTPKMHIIHHSAKQYESDTNYGFCLSFWDRLFKTYTDKEEEGFTIGQAHFREQKDDRLDKLLLQAFR